MAYAASAEPSRRADLWFDGPTRQRRWTVLIRWILVFPQLIVVGVLVFAAELVAFVGWFAALFTGRLPEGIHTFIAGVVRWQARVNAYYLLLTDHYPPYEFVDEPYPARPVLPAAGTLNRLAVFFRLILALPAFVFVELVTLGLGIPLLFITWLIMVCSGQMPAALYWAYAALVRYQYRVYAYLFLLTSEYSWGMLGDRAPEASPGSPPPAAPAWPPPAPPAPAAGAVAPPPPTMGGTPPPPPPPSGGAERGRLLLPRAARGWIIFSIIWGLVLVGAYAGGIVTISVHVTTTASQHDTIVNDFNAPTGPKATVQAALNKAQSCATVTCLQPSHYAAASSLQLFASELRGLSLPSNAQPQARAVESDADQLASAFTQLANSPTAQAYRTTVQSSGFATLIQSLPVDTNNLLHALTQNVF